MLPLRRTARLVPALAGLALLATACSSSSSTSASDGSAQKLLDAARSQAASLASFAFRSVTELPGTTALQRTVLEGRAAVPDRVDYTLTVGASRTEVVRIGSAGYTRRLPNGSWTKDATPSAAAAPAAVLQAVLNAADGPVDKGQVRFDGHDARLVSVTLTADEVRSTGLLDATGGSAVPVTLALDPTGRVLRLAVEIPVRGRTTTVVRQVTTYGSFGTAAPVTAPA